MCNIPYQNGIKHLIYFCKCTYSSGMFTLPPFLYHYFMSYVYIVYIVYSLHSFLHCYWNWLFNHIVHVYSDNKGILFYMLVHTHSTKLWRRSAFEGYVKVVTRCADVIWLRAQFYHNEKKMTLQASEIMLNTTILN